MTSSTSGSIAVEIADHLPVFSLPHDSLLSPSPDTIEVRDLKRFDEIAFCDELRNEKWNSVYNSSDATEGLTRFPHIFNWISNKHAPIAVITVEPTVKRYK